MYPLHDGRRLRSANRLSGGSVAEDLDQDLVGTIGFVSVPIGATRPGEVVLPVRGGTEAYAAFADEPLAKNTRVIVTEARSARSVNVIECP